MFVNFRLKRRIVNYITLNKNKFSIVRITKSLLFVCLKNMVDIGILGSHVTEYSVAYSKH